MTPTQHMEVLTLLCTSLEGSTVAICDIPSSRLLRMGCVGIFLLDRLCCGLSLPSKSVAAFGPAEDAMWVKNGVRIRCLSASDLGEKAHILHLKSGSLVWWR